MKPLRHPDLLKQMTLKEKIALCSGQSFWKTKAMSAHGIRQLFLCDGPHGLRKQEDATDILGINQSLPATCFPTAALTACSWDPALLEEMGAAIGAEAAAMGVDVVLGPGANLKRDPRCGRNFEYFSEDPYLAGKLAAGEIRGLQRNGVAASLKHFACNSQEYRRTMSDSILDPRTLRELYLTAFEIAVTEARPATVMCAYNKLNGTYCSDHRQLLTEILREEWGFDGLVVTDWGALHDRIAAFRAGCDLAMPGGSAYMEREAERAVAAGQLAEADIDRCADRVLTLIDRCTADVRPCDRDAHHTLARRIAAESAVLLQNRENLLPLSPDRTAVLIGAMAKTPRYQGSGSSHINPTRLVSVCEALPELPHVMGCREDGSTTAALLEEAAAAARQADTAVVFAGLTDLYESEGFDRKDLRMPDGHLQLIEAVAAANPNTVVVLTCGSAVECPWADRVKSILYLGLPGQAGGEAAVDLLFGRVSPSGKLAETWPLTYDQCPTAPDYGEQDAQYRESLYVGYRCFDKAAQPVRWAFGHGLSYSAFVWHDLEITHTQVSCRITNTGPVPAAEVAQLYVEPPQCGLHRPLRELKGFQKLFLQPGQTGTVTFPLTDRTFALWQDGWVVPGGTYTLHVGGSSRDLPLRGALTLDGPTLPSPHWQPGSWYETLRGTPEQSGWEAMLGRTYTPSTVERGRFTKEHSVLQMSGQSRLMRWMLNIVKAYVARGFGGKQDESDPAYCMMVASSCDAALFNRMNNSGMPPKLFELLLKLANGFKRTGGTP